MRLRLALTLPLALTLGGCARMLDDVVASAVSEPASAIAARPGADPMPGDVQTLMTRRAPAKPGDAARAARLAEALTASIARYRDVRDAERDGYRPFPANPPAEMRIVHYTNSKRSRKEGKRLDPREPGSLLYERMKDGSLRLVGAMVTAPPSATLEELDARVPLSVTQWHLHQNVCVPRPVWDKEAWARRAADGRPLFGPGGATITTERCEAIGGRFLPAVFGWMAHVHVFAPDSADLWNPMYGHGEHGHGSGRGAHDH